MSRTSKRFVFGASILGLATLGMSACGPSVGSDSAAETDVDYSDVEPADKITFWTNHPGGSMDIEKQIVADFKKESGIDVELVTAGANYEEVSQKFQTAQNSDEVGDMVVVSDATWFTNFANDSLLPVDKVLESAESDTSTYQETLFDDYLYEDAHYAVPYARSTPIFYYNKDHYKKAGLDDKAPATWEDVKANSEKLQEKKTAKSALSYPKEDAYPAWILGNMVWGYGGGWSNDWDMSAMTSPETVEAVQFAQDSTKDGWANVSSGVPEDDFAAGATSQVLGSTGSLAGILESADFEVGVGFLPGGPKETDKVVPTGGAGVGISAKSSPEEQLASAMFLDYLTNSENTATFSEGTGYLPVRTDADMSKVYEKTPQFEVAVDQLEKTRTQDPGRVLLPGGDTTIAKSLQKILTSDADVTEELQGAQDELQGLYDNDLPDKLKN